MTISDPNGRKTIEPPILDAYRSVDGLTLRCGASTAAPGTSTRPTPPAPTAI
jgi:hypothetical protein